MLLCITKYHNVLQTNTTTITYKILLTPYISVLQSIAWYYQVLPRTEQFNSVPQSSSTHYKVLVRTTKYYSTYCKVLLRSTPYYKVLLGPPSSVTTTFMFDSHNTWNVRESAWLSDAKPNVITTLMFDCGKNITRPMQCAEQAMGCKKRNVTTAFMSDSGNTRDAQESMRSNL